MGININTYRARIGLHNAYRIKSNSSKRPGNISGKFLDIFDFFLYFLIPAVGYFIKSILLFVCLLSFLFDMTESRPNTNDCIAARSVQIYNAYNEIQYTDYRFILTGLFYSILYIIPCSIQILLTNGLNNSIKALSFFTKDYFFIKIG